MMESEEYQNSLFYSKKGYHTYIGNSKKRTFILVYLFSLKIVEMLKGGQIGIRPNLSSSFSFNVDGRRIANFIRDHRLGLKTGSSIIKKQKKSANLLIKSSGFPTRLSNAI